ncbi:hypothetical protein CEXT_66771 [Caerostris extrusa]|uniref:Uncharacterized protein n=1 Tax=Caerostris extrusa TaxID=172846 RepID=A0AAV4MI56_CAEEX|nr:hypothetical protein CEXT_66771 [Caerostris extrusa]
MLESVEHHIQGFKIGVPHADHEQTTDRCRGGRQCVAEGLSEIIAPNLCITGKKNKSEEGFFRVLWLTRYHRSPIDVNSVKREKNCPNDSSENSQMVARHTESL